MNLKSRAHRALAMEVRHDPRQVSRGAGLAGRGALEEQAIRARAYEIYQSRQGAPGDPVADWLQAEQELKAGESNPARGEVLMREDE